MSARPTRRTHAVGRLLAASLLAISAPVLADEDGLPSLDVKGLLDARLAVDGDTVSWEDRGLGKTRYGGGSDVTARLAEAALVLQPRITWDLSGFVHVTANSQQRHAVDVVEAYLTYKPAPTGAWGVRAKAGAFFPPISLENTGLAWTSPYTISSSAINSWVGEELRSVGGEATLFHQTEDIRLSLTGSGFYFNDPAGSVLSWRGWAIHDREAGLGERLALPNVRIVRSSGRLFRQAPFIQPFVELDDRAAYYVAVRAESPNWGEVRAMYYNNSADDLELKNGQWPWHTTFKSFGAKARLPADVDVIAQYLTGSTSVVTIPGAASPVVYVDYRSAFLLASKAWDRHRVSLRAEYFETTDEDVLFPDDNTERGTGITAAYVYRPTDSQRVTLEYLQVHSTRPERLFSFGLPRTATEREFQISYRFIF